MSPRRKTRAKAGYMISSVAELYKLHPQTLRLYERVGLLKPSRSQGNTRLYTDDDLERLEVILTLARDMGVNLAGIEIIKILFSHPENPVSATHPEVPGIIFEDLVDLVVEHSLARGVSGELAVSEPV